jgi:hypothetical protein
MANIDQDKTEFIFTYEKEVTAERIADLKKRLNKLKTDDDKLKFLKKEKANYLQHISAETLFVSGSVHSNFQPGTELFWDRILQIEIDTLEGCQKNELKEVYSHREYILANQYKHKLGIEPFKHSNDWAKERGDKARQKFYTLTENSTKYKPPTIDELTNVIELLKDFPEAQKIAINKLGSLKNL